MKKTILTILILALAAVCGKARPLIIPEPANYTAGKGSFTIPATIGVAGENKVVSSAMKYLDRNGFNTKKSSSDKAVIKVAIKPELEPEHYQLTVDDKGITLAAGDNAALMYGLESFAQLATSGNGTIEACSIDDKPRFGYRGLMLDVVRYFIEPQEIERIIDVAAKLKLNNLHLHLCDDNGWRLEIKKYPRLTEVGAWRVDRPEMFPGRLNARSADEKATVGGFYTQKEMRQLVKYAAERNINIIPEIEMPAHSIAAIASYPELACPVVDKFVGVFPGIGGKDASIILCAGKEHTFTFIENVLDEVMKIFPSPTIHLGGDEANKRIWQQCPLCNKRIEEEHLADHEALQGSLMDRVIRYVNSRGRKAMGWDEVTYGKPKEDIIVYGWQGDGSVAVNDSRATGRKFIMTPARSTYLIRYQGPQWFEPFTYFGNITLRDVYNFEPMTSDWDNALRSNLLGIQGSLWSEFCNSPSDVQYQIFPRLMAIADVAWRPEGRSNWGAFLKALDAFCPTLDKLGITYARSMYNLDHNVRGNGKELKVNVSCIRPDVDVRYSVDNQALDKAWSDTLRLNKAATIYAATFKGDKQMGKTLKLSLDFNKATSHSVSGNCTNGLTRVLTNGLRGSDRNSDFEWAGWWNETAEFVLDMGEVVPVNKVTLGSLVHSDICIAAPTHIYVYTSDDGKSFTLRRTIDTPAENIYHKQAKIFDIDCSFNADTRYIKFVAVNPGCVPDGYAREGAPTWMYFDEITVN